MKGHIRRFQPGDERHITYVIKTCYDEFGFTFDPEGYNRDCVQVAQYYAHERSAFFVLEVDGKIVGTGGFIPLNEERCELRRLYLLKEFRGKGLGREFFAYILQQAHAMGFKEMEIWSDKSLTDAHKLYERFGAERITDRICNDPDQSCEWGYLLDIPEALHAGSPA